MLEIKIILVNPEKKKKKKKKTGWCKTFDFQYICAQCTFLLEISTTFSTTKKPCEKNKQKKTKLCCDS